MLDLGRHLRERHPVVSFEAHKRLPVPSDETLQEAAHQKYYMQYRKVEQCKVYGCKNFGHSFKNLSKHLMTQHNLNRDQYKKLVNMEPSKT